MHNLNAMHEANGYNKKKGVMKFKYPRFCAIQICGEAVPMFTGTLFSVPCRATPHPGPRRDSTYQLRARLEQEVYTPTTQTSIFRD